MLRRVLNKLKGQHVPEFDPEEFLRFIEAVGEDDLRAFCIADNKKLKDPLSDGEKGIQPDKVYEVVIECPDELEQKKTYEELIEKGYNCKVLTL